MRRYLLKIVLILLFLSGLAQATTYYVKPSGNDSNNGTSESTAWQHVCRACTTVVAGDTVLIRAGTYNENCNCSNFCNEGGEPACGPLTPENSGSAGNYIVYKGYPGERPTIKGDLGGDYDDYGICISDRSYIVLDSLIVTESYRGITIVNGAHHIIVKNCKVFDTSGPLDGDNTGGIFFLHDVQNYACTVQACTTYDNKLSSGNQWNAMGIGGYNCTNCLVEDCVAHTQTGGFGFRWKAVDTTCVFRRCVAYNCNVGIGLFAQWAYSNDAYENIIYDCTDGILISDEYTNNNNNQAWNNTIYNCSSSGIKLQDYEYHIYNFESWNNIVMNCGNGYEAWTNETINNVTNLYSDYNCFYDVGGSDVVMWGYDNRYTLAEYVAITSDLDENSIQQNPLFVNAPNHDFHLQESSPCRGTGLDGIDMGAYPTGNGNGGTQKKLGIRRE